MPTRYLKPGIRDSEAIDKLSPHAEVLFYRLIVTVDDFGRADARPAMVKAQCFPVRESATAAKCSEWLQELARAGLVDLYTADEKPYLQMRKWDNNPRAKESRFPAPADGCMQVYASARNPHTVLPETGTGTGTGTETGTECAWRTLARSRAPSCPEDVAESVWSDWLRLRKAKRAPVTVTVLEGARAEAGKAGLTLEAFLRVWCTRGSQALQADWLTPAERQQAAPEPAWRTEQRERMRQFAPGITVPGPRRAGDIIDLEESQHASQQRLD